MFLIYFVLYFFQIEVRNCKALQFNSNFRIMGGEETNILTYPYMVNIIKKRQNYIDCSFGGTIINSKWILTAARPTQRISDNNEDIYLVVAGSTSCYNIEEGGQVISIQKIIMHPEYKFDEKNTMNFKNNIAVIRLEKELIFNLRVQPVQLAKSLTSNNLLPITNDGVCESMGWGSHEEDTTKSPELLSVKLSLISSELCVEILKNFYKTIDVTSVYCTLNSQGKRGLCFGDSSGPLMCDNYQIAISSGDIGCTSQYIPVLWTRVDVYYDWIQSAIQRKYSKSKSLVNNSSNLNSSLLLVIIMLLYLQ